SPVGRADEREGRERQQRREPDAGGAITILWRRLRNRPESERRRPATGEVEHGLGRRLPRRPKGAEAVPAARRHPGCLVPTAGRPPRPVERRVTPPRSAEQRLAAKRHTPDHVI